MEWELGQVEQRQVFWWTLKRSGSHLSSSGQAAVQMPSHCTRPFIHPYFIHSYHPLKCLGLPVYLTLRWIPERTVTGLASLRRQSDVQSPPMIQSRAGPSEVARVFQGPGDGTWERKELVKGGSRLGGPQKG